MLGTLPPHHNNQFHPIPLVEAFYVPRGQVSILNPTLVPSPTVIREA